MMSCKPKEGAAEGDLMTSDEVFDHHFQMGLRLFRGMDKVFRGNCPIGCMVALSIGVHKLAGDMELSPQVAMEILTEFAKIADGRKAHALEMMVPMGNA
jgi:hypothetical protein